LVVDHSHPRDHPSRSHLLLIQLMTGQGGELQKRRTWVAQLKARGVTSGFIDIFDKRSRKHTPQKKNENHCLSRVRVWSYAKNVAKNCSETTKHHPQRKGVL
jgi:hypothetical protein